MAERALRGARLGAQSFEDERGVEMAPRQEVAYVLPDGRTFTVTMAEEAEVPLQWEDPKSGIVGRLVDGAEPEAKDEKHVRTHWDMLLERRSVDELEEILTERIELLRAGEIGPPHLHRRTKKAAARR
ncbi:MAG: RNA polymerase-binding protein RbpA [Aeromicrobium sp.]|uniref:RNA polymerase-binding protein RbpA n=1 Tax=Aeromicrobium sp. TaxID=1871063 RepID=UPI0025C1C0DA|nr:RNA polymerase-binding protein RbpA [Aeromicrobium sp.]MCK5890909.1 RNA polymerase-binding protein RbpA [Aeromicrobium sp.]MDF1705103.1 RNA polymerase-binding protein RbpA [Aeromicrobium sp.]